MREFKDNQGRTWPVNMTVAALKRIKARVGYVPGTPGSEAVDLCVLADTLYAVCVEDPNEMPQEAFDNRLDGVLGDAISALEQEVADFFRRQNLATEETTPTESPQTSRSLSTD